MAWNIRKLINANSSTIDSDGTLKDDTVDSDVIEDLSVVNADVSASAAIAHTKLAALSGQGYVILGGAAGALGELDASGDAKIMVGNGTTVTSVAVSGDATLSNAGAVTIANDAVETAMIKDGEVTEAKLATAVTGGLNVKRTAKATFDYTTMGTVATHGSGVTLPDNAIITNAFYDVTTTCESADTGGGVDKATIAINIPTDGDLQAATAIETGTTYDAGLHDMATKGTDDGAVGTMIKTADAREISFVVAVDPVTAGEFNVFIEYVVSD